MFAIETDLARSQRKSVGREAKPDLIRFTGQKAVHFVTGLSVTGLRREHSARESASRAENLFIAM